MNYLSNNFFKTIILFLILQGLTARRLLSIQKCYVSKLDPTLPTPQKLKIDMDLVSFFKFEEDNCAVLGFCSHLHYLALQAKLKNNNNNKQTANKQNIFFIRTNECSLFFKKGL